MVVACLAGLAAVSMATLWAFQLQVLRILARPRPEGGERPPISILKPLAGLDEGLLDNLRSIARQDYPTFEILFGIADPNDPARSVVETLRSEFPEVPIRLVVTSPDIGRNPKVNNLAGMTGHARYDHLLVSDANVRVDPHYLQAMAAEIAQKDVGLVCSILVGSRAQSLGAIFEDLHLNTFIAPAICGAREIGDHPCVVGKSMLLRRSDLETLGGWYGVRNVLAEDYVLGQRYHARKWRVALSPHVVEAVHVKRPLWQFFNRHVRWAQMRRRVQLSTYIGEMLLNPTPACLALLAAGLHAHNRAAVVSATTLIALKCVVDAALSSRLTGRRIPWWHPFIIPLKDCVIAGVWAVGMVRRRVMWRGHPLRIGRGSALLAPDEPDVAPNFDVVYGAGHSR